MIDKEDKDFIEALYSLDSRSDSDIYDLIDDLVEERDEYRVHAESLARDIDLVRQYIQER